MLTQEVLSNLNIHYNAIIRMSASKIGLTSSQAYHILSIPHDGISMTGLASRVGLDASTLTRNIQNLERSGHVTREPSQYDKRALVVKLSRIGADSLRAIEEDLEILNQKIVGSLELEKQELFLEILEEYVWLLDCERLK